MPNLRIATSATLAGDGLHCDIAYTDAGTPWTDASMTELDSGLRPLFTVNTIDRSCTYVSAVVSGSSLVVTVLLASQVYAGDAVSAVTGAAGWLGNATSQETGSAALAGISGGSFEPTPAERRAGSIGMGDMGIGL